MRLLRCRSKPKQEHRGLRRSHMDQLNSSARPSSQKSKSTSSDTLPSAKVARNVHSQLLSSVLASQTSVDVVPALMPAPMSNLPQSLPSSDTSIPTIFWSVLLLTSNEYSAAAVPDSATSMIASVVRCIVSSPVV